MSLARVYTTKGPVRKDGLTCGKCGKEIKKGVDRRRTFAVGYRGWEQTRCMDAACTPTRAERESSAVASVYDVIDGIDFDSLTEVGEFEEARDSVAEALRGVASEYEENEMFEINYDLQERAETLNSSADEIEGWEPENEAPEPDSDEYHEQECETCAGTGEIHEDDYTDPEDCEDCGGTGTLDAESDFDSDLEAWLEETRASLEDAINSLETP